MRRALAVVLWLLPAAALAEVGPQGEWVSTGSPSGTTVEQSLVTVPDGTALLIAKTVQRYVVDTGAWASAGALIGNGGVPTVLANGKVLVSGLSPAEVYDPASGTSVPTGAMIIPRTGHQATLLASGDVLVSGGLDANGSLVGPAERFHPANGTWTLTGTLLTPRTDHTALLLPTGKVLVVGGGTTAAELYDPTAGTWRSTTPNAVGGSASTLLQNGLALITGTVSVVSHSSVGQSQLYDAIAETWSPTVSTGVSAAFSTRAITSILNDGRVLVLVYGLCGTGGAALFDPVAGVWSPAATPPSRTPPLVTLLPDGRALAVAPACGGPSGTAALFRPDNATARLAIAPAALDLGNVAIGASVQQPLSVQNTGQAPLGGSVAVTGTGFSVQSGGTFSVGPGGSAPAIIGFAAAGFGSFPGTATFMSNGGWQTVSLQAHVGLRLSGRVTGSDGLGVQNVPVELHGASSATTTTDSDGGYRFFVAPNGSYTIVPASPVLGFNPTNRTIAAGTENVGGLDFVVTTISGPALQAAVLPGSRAARVGAVTTGFATIINASGAAGASCGISPITGVPAAFAYQTTSPATNEVTGTPDTPVTIPAGAAQTFVFAFTPTAAFSPTDVALRFDCANTDPAPVVSGLNTFLLSASTTPVPDIVALAVTPTGDGIVNVPGPTGTGVFAVATSNVGIGAAITVSADIGGATPPIGITLCPTNPATSVCLVPPAATATIQIDGNATPTFGIFVAGTGTIPFDPAVNRVFVRFKDAGNVTRGSTSVAVRTAP